MDVETPGRRKAQPMDRFAMGFMEFVAMMAVLMALTALSVDIMLPALPDISADYALSDPNDRQFVVTAYMAAFAAGHIVFGPMSDRLGRRPALAVGLVIYAVGSALAVVATSFEMLIAARVIQGLGAAGPRVVAVAVVRDRFVGRDMSRVMGFVLSVFIMLPVVAPAIGAAIIAFGDWHLVFVFLLAYGGMIIAWVMARLPETHPESVRRAHPPAGIWPATVQIARSRQAVGYMVGLGFTFGCLIAYIASAQQLLSDLYGIVDWFPAVFALVAGGIVVASFLNAGLVRRVGMRRVSHGAALGMVALSAAASALVLVAPVPPVALLVAFFVGAFLCIGLILPNFNAIAMEPLGAIAGTGSAFIGFVMVGMGVVLGGIAAQFYAGTAQAIVFAYLVFSAAIVVSMAFTERGRLMRPTRAT